MLERTCGPPRKPVWAATNRSTASVKRTNAAKSSALLPCHRLFTRSPKRTALSVFPWTGVTPFRTYPRMIPPAMKARENARYAIARFPV